MTSLILSYMLASCLNPRLAPFEGPIRIHELLGGSQALEVRNRVRDLGPDLRIDEEPAQRDQDARDHGVGERDGLPDEVLLLPAGERDLDPPAGALDAGQVEAVAGLVVRHHLQDAHEGEGQEVGDELRLREEDPLGDAGLGLGVGAQELRALRPRRREVLADGGALGHAEPVGALERGHLAHGELGQELRRLVRLAHLEVLCERYLEAV